MVIFWIGWRGILRRHWRNSLRIKRQESGIKIDELLDSGDL
jgi:hypothetical protein